jgi:hypothetical protein
VQPELNSEGGVEFAASTKFGQKSRQNGSRAGLGRHSRSAV